MVTLYLIQANRRSDNKLIFKYTPFTANYEYQYTKSKTSPKRSFSGKHSDSLLAKCQLRASQGADTTLIQSSQF